MKVSIDMGSGPGGKPAELDLEELLATRLLVQGNSGSGKSHLLRRLLEQSAPWVQQAVIDPEGDFVTLADRFGHVVVEAADHTEAALQRIASRVREHRVSVVLNLEGLDSEAQMRAAASFLGGLFDADRDLWYPMLVVVDEAQLFAPAAAGEVSDEARKVSLGAMTNLMCRGRKRGLAGVIATQRLAKLAKNVAAEASNFLMGRTFLDIDMARAADLLGMERRQAEMFRDLERGHFVALGPAMARRPLPVRIGDVETAPRAGSPKLLPLPDTPEDARALIMVPGEPEPSALPAIPRRPPAPPPMSTTEVLMQLARSRPAAAPAESEPEGDPEERDRRLDAILREVLADPDAAFRTVAVLYQDFLVRCRIHAVGGRPPDMPDFRRRLAAARAGVAAGADDTPEWERATAAASGLPDDIQGVFLLLARAALDGAPCPSDHVIARACGSRSAGRARRLLSYLEQRDVLVTRSDRGGRRIVTLPGLGWETAPGDPNAADPDAEGDALAAAG
ncbi:ATP-binding protein [Azospirillum sp. RWY-5-1]|uniref:ATP-binding protein n=1 Tax=Azospirillum oleiclasticum TaxID=2735135 RepID=A0ABX2TGP6_9PROT|nr:ATP-binding protein [Azospirillum oleiclasticum]NYZ15987.1 ATP-binding protein [Azospirillum oleiclasticum]NYZ23534.1 ATP-binding protein [Azospirillum oleiclasticum]